MSALDTNYFRGKLALIGRDLSHYTAQEMARELVRLAKVADETEAVKEAPSAPVATIDERSAFEKAARQITHSDDSSFEREGDDYADYTQSRHWAFWKARAALSVKAAPAAIPDGWQLVPINPTQPMRDDGNKKLDQIKAEPGMGMADRAFYAYGAMLAAAPTPPTTGEAT